MINYVYTDLPDPAWAKEKNLEGRQVSMVREGKLSVAVAHFPQEREEVLEAHRRNLKRLQMDPDEAFADLIAEIEGDLIAEIEGDQI